MKKTAKIAIGVGAGILAAAGALVLADRYLGNNMLGSPTGKVVGRCYKNGKFYLYVKRFNRVNEVEVDRETCAAVANGDYFNMASEGAVADTRRRAQPEEVLNNVPDADELAEIFGEEPVCSCVGTCKGEHICGDNCGCGDDHECECGDACECEDTCECPSCGQ